MRFFREFDKTELKCACAYESMCTYVYMFPDGTSEKYNKQTPNISPIGFCQGELWKHINNELLLFSEFVLDNFFGGLIPKELGEAQAVVWQKLTTAGQHN